ncbi:MAG: hypothetical protein ABI690_29580 [Chloroflexota bacterium]
MKYYVQVMKPGTGEKWHQVNSWTNKNAAIGDAQHTYSNRDNPASRDVMAVRVVQGKRNPIVIFERITS